MDENVVDLIMNDHREMERMFETLKTQPDKRAQLAPVMVALLTAHERAEELEVYPAAAEAGGTKDVQHSQKEHLAADQLAKKVAETDPSSPDFDTALTELIDAVSHHVEEEESSVLPGMRENLPAERLDELGRAFLESRKEHLGDMPDDITRDELVQQARNAGMSGATGDSKEELEGRLADAAEE